MSTALLSLMPKKGLLCFSLLALAACGDKDSTGDTGDPPAAQDTDGDGVADDEDCDPSDGDIYSGAPELEDYLDNDCDGTADEGTERYDDDEDGYTERQGDCDDADASLNPDALEIAYDGIDQDCEGADLTDVDGDGYDAEDVGGADCDDSTADISPDASEWANGADDNCDGSIDEDTDVVDDDGDGYAESEGDCDDDDDTRHPGVEEIAYDGIDQDCDLQDLRDLDGDGFNGEPAGGTDCDDNNSSIYPDASEVAYDGIDQDCDGADLLDQDGDGFVSSEGDCDDLDDSVCPDCLESADYLDNNCNGIIDEGTVFGDDDLDGWSESQGDCDDADRFRFPDAVEVVNGVDDDCNDLVDEQNLDDAVPIQSPSTGNYFGMSLASGDVDGDGATDLLIAARYDDTTFSNGGQVWAISGDTAGGSANDAALYSFVGTRNNSYTGSVIHTVPDLNGDGADEMLIGAPNDYLSTTTYEGITYLVPGAPGGTYAMGTRLSDAATDLFHGGTTYTYSPDSLSAGDLNGDGIAEIAIGLDSYSNYKGGVFLFDGSAGLGAWGSATLAAAADSIVTGADRPDYLGVGSWIVPDLDGDGYSELLARSSNDRSIYFFDGDTLWTGAPISSTSAYTIFLDSSGSGYNWGWDLDVDDIDGDDDMDVAVANNSGSGAVMLFANSGTGWSGTVNSYAAEASVAGNADGFGYSVELYDTDGDGQMEALAGAYNYSEVATGAGAVFILPTDDLSTLNGTTHSDYGRPVIGETSSEYLGYSAAAGDDWWAMGGQGSSGTVAFSVYLIPDP